MTLKFPSIFLRKSRTPQSAAAAASRGESSGENQGNEIPMKRSHLCSLALLGAVRAGNCNSIVTAEAVDSGEVFRRNCFHGVVDYLPGVCLME